MSLLCTSTPPPQNKPEQPVLPKEGSCVRNFGRLLCRCKSEQQFHDQEECSSGAHLSLPNLCYKPQNLLSGENLHPTVYHVSRERDAFCVLV